MSDRDEESIGKMRTWGHEESARSPQESAWDPGMSIGGLTTRRPEGIDDDGRTDGARRWKAGEEILGRYMVERELGQGGMGVVYGCFDKTGGVKVAVKCLPPELSHNSVEMEEVRENFELVVGLRHPNIAGVRTLEKDGRGEYYLVMDVAEEENLRAWLRRKWKAGGVSLEEAVGVLRQVASALDYAHGEKVVHRDVKPGNVMIDGRGRVKVLDFGLAAQIRTSMSRASHVYRGTSGTGPYMAPEQWRGRRQDGKTDQYALGVMAYEMLAGHLPFENDEVSVLREVVLKEEPEDIPGVPEGAMAAIRRAMSKSAEERFGSCGEFVEALESGGNGGASTPCEPGKGTSAGTAAGRSEGTTARSESSPHHRSVGGWMAALVLVAAIGAGVWGWREYGAGWMGNVAEQAARPEGSPHQEVAQSEDDKRAEEERLAAEKAAEEKRLAEQKAAEEEAARLEEERKKKLEEAVYRLAAEAKSKTEAVGEYDGGQGFGERLDEAKSKLRQGEAAIQGRNFEKAEEWLEESLAAAKWLEENAPLREDAIQAGRVAVAAKKKADAMDGERLNLPSYQRGNERSMEGAKAFANARFKDATTAWTAAGKAYATAETEARNEKVRQGLEAAREAKRRGALEEVVAAANGVLTLDAGNTEAQWLKEEAETKLKPILVVSAVLAGGPGPLGAPNAVLKLGSTTYTLPATIDCSDLFSIGPGTVELAKGGKAHGTFERMKIDWKGEKRVGVELKLTEVSIDLGNNVNLEMVHCPGVAADFWMGKYEVTQEQWRQVTGNSPSVFDGKPRNPVENVSWNDCQDFVRALNALPSARNSGLTFRLPEDWEWEKACRAGAPKSADYCKLADGTQITKATLSRVARYDKGWNDGPVAVGSFLPNAWGLYDMLGNVWEWMQTADGSMHVTRGGSFNDATWNCAAGRRGWSHHGLQRRFLGLRLAASGRAATR